MIRLYDTLAREKRDFKPQDPSRITMYVCGPTVYGRAHIGNARPAVVFDTLARLIRHEFGADSLVYARNVTDVDDKIIAAAEAQGISPREIAVRYEEHYLEDMAALGVQPPDFAPHATAFVPGMIDMIKRLISGGFAYEASGHVLFEIAKDPQYGILSKRDPEAIRAGARVEVASFKRDPGDFVLWKPSSDNVIGWDSPWGRGRPGWHIECSAMIEAFGSRQDAGHVETIDIHGGGLDLIFPHHENEIAQSRCAHGGAPLANYWVHNGFVDMGAEKMSKSLGNIVTARELLDQGQHGETLRLALLSAHYRSPLPWTEALVGRQLQTLDKLARRFAEPFNLSRWNSALWTGVAPDEAAVDALRDDLNTPQFIAELHRLADETKSETNESASQDIARCLGATAALIGIDLAEFLDRKFAAAADDFLITSRIGERAEAKANRDFAAADRIRDELKAEGIILEDGPEGTTWRRE